MVLIAIIVATLLAGVGSVWLAAMVLAWTAGGRNASNGTAQTQYLLSLAAGALLATAFVHLLPEAFESHLSPAHLFACLLAGLVFFFLLDKAELWHHGHEHHHGADLHADHGHDHAEHQHPVQPAVGGGAWAVLMGDSLHCFGDGMLIASAFVADIRLGALAALAVLTHEVPHHMGDLVVLRQGSARRQALVKVSLAGATTLLGGLIGFWVVGRLEAYLPYFLVVAASSFVYVALADLIPQLQRRLRLGQTLAQIAWLAVGMAVVTLASSWGA